MERAVLRKWLGFKLITEEWEWISYTNTLEKNILGKKKEQVLLTNVYFIDELIVYID